MEDKEAVALSKLAQDLLDDLHDLTYSKSKYQQELQLIIDAFEQVKMSTLAEVVLTQIKPTCSCEVYETCSICEGTDRDLSEVFNEPEPLGKGEYSGIVQSTYVKP